MLGPAAGHASPCPGTNSGLARTGATNGAGAGTGAGTGTGGIGLSDGTNDFGIGLALCSML